VGAGDGAVSGGFVLQQLYGFSGEADGVEVQRSGWKEQTLPYVERVGHRVGASFYRAGRDLSDQGWKGGDSGDFTEFIWIEADRIVTVGGVALTSGAGVE